MRTILLSVVFFISMASMAQNERVGFSASSTNVQEGETFMLSISAHSDGKADLNLPNGIEVLNSSRNVSSSSSFTIIINGKIQQSNKNQTIEYNYTCRINKAGTYTIGGATFQSANKLYRLNPISIIVSKAPPMSNSLKGNLNKNFFGIINPTRSKVYVGEAFTVSSKVYSRARLTDVAEYKPSESSGTLFKTDLFKDRKNIDAKLERIQGIPFQTVEVSRELIIPQKSGEINFSPFQIKIGYQGNFFFSDYTNVRSGSASVKVLPLPQGAPASFQGAVGTFDAQAKASKTHLKEGEAFTYTITVSGTGNLHLLSNPELVLPDAFELYGDPKVNENHSFSINGAEGSVKYEFIVRALEKGNYNFQAFEFSYFNPKLEKYIRVPIETLDIKVEQGDSSSELSAFGPKSDLKIKNQGIQYIVTQASEDSSFFLWTSGLFWAILLFPFLFAAPLGWYLKKRKLNRNEIEAKQKEKNAGKFAAKQLQKAQELLSNGERKAFNEELYTVLLTFISQKAKENSASLSRERMEQVLSLHVDDNTLNEFQDVWSELEALKFGMYGSTSSEETLQKVGQLIDKIELQWKRK